MLDPFGLRVIERRQLGQGRGLGFVKDAFGHSLQSSPARPIELRCVRNLAKDAAPFDDDAIDIAGSEQFGNPCRFAERVFVD